jgi:hypothetical protein
MSIRGQSPEAWRARFRKGTCPMHGTGFVDVDAADPAAGEQQDGAASYRVQRCVGRVGEPCAILVARFAGKDEHHASFGWVKGPDDIRAALAHAGELAATGVRPGKWGKEVRVSHPLETT